MYRWYSYVRCWFFSIVPYALFLLSCLFPVSYLCYVLLCLAGWFGECSALWKVKTWRKYPFYWEYWYICEESCIRLYLPQQELCACRIRECAKYPLGKKTINSVPAVVICRSREILVSSPCMHIQQKNSGVIRKDDPEFLLLFSCGHFNLFLKCVKISLFTSSDVWHLYNRLTCWLEELISTITL